ncbi:MAG TPA: four helix bundle protein [Planctomycetaceae bacterium]|nr:four helix bundle protein [Planctomycetaceae bacterium]
MKSWRWPKAVEPLAGRTSNIEHPTSNIEMPERRFSGKSERGTGRAADTPSSDGRERRSYDLAERLLSYAATVIRLVERLPSTRAGNHIAGQVLKSGTSPLPNHGEVQTAESPRDFLHKMRICLKELRESERWLRLIERVPLLSLPDAELRWLIGETDELIRIFVASIRTSERKSR